MTRLIKLRFNLKRWVATHACDHQGTTGSVLIETGRQKMFWCDRCEERVTPDYQHHIFCPQYREDIAATSHERGWDEGRSQLTSEVTSLRAERDRLQKELDDERDQGSCSCGYFGMTALEKIREGDFHAEGCSYFTRPATTVPFGDVI